MSIFDGLSVFPPRLPFDLIVQDAQQQKRTPCDVPAGRERVHPRPPSKVRGRRGTRKRWKRAHPPYWRPLFRYREPVDILIMAGSARLAPFPLSQMRVTPPDVWIVTPAQERLIYELATRKTPV